MPTGTGKTVCLLSLILSYIKMKKPSFKLVYCTRTIVEMEKTLDELKFVMDSREKDFSSPMEPEILHQLNRVIPPGEEIPSASQLKSPILAMCLSSRKNLCINEKVNCYDEREKVDSECRARTATWVRDRVQSKKQEDGGEEVKAMKPTKA
jgi:DNA excision repair protein ERCC-2